MRQDDRLPLLVRYGAALAALYLLPVGPWVLSRLVSIQEPPWDDPRPIPVLIAVAALSVGILLTFTAITGRLPRWVAGMTARNRAPEGRNAIRLVAQLVFYAAAVSFAFWVGTAMLGWGGLILAIPGLLFAGALGRMLETGPWRALVAAVLGSMLGFYVFGKRFLFYTLFAACGSHPPEWMNPCERYVRSILHWRADDAAYAAVFGVMAWVGWLTAHRLVRVSPPEDAATAT